MPLPRRRWSIYVVCRERVTTGPVTSVSCEADVTAEAGNWAARQPGGTGPHVSRGNRAARQPADRLLQKTLDSLQLLLI